MRTFIAALTAAAVQADSGTAAFKALILEHKQLVNSNYQPITITVDGVETEKYVASEGCVSKNKQFTCEMSERGYIINDPIFDTKKPNFFMPNLLGGSVEFTVDMSEHECGCMNNFYAVKMPAHGPNGKPRPTDGYYYCDANAGKSSGEFCPEFDFMEGNKFGF